MKLKTINEQVRIIISKESTLITDDSTSYTGFEKLVEKHQSQVIRNRLEKFYLGYTSDPLILVYLF